MCEGDSTLQRLSKLRTMPQRKIDVTSKSPVGDISVVTLIRTDTTLDHSQKAEKVCFMTFAGLGLPLASPKYTAFVNTAVTRVQTKSKPLYRGHIDVIGTRKSTAARKQAVTKEILLWMTPSENLTALQTSVCSELLSPTRAD